ncbi:MAG: DUF3368 domain-containing protein [Planctomycetes bacterium]|nr:DUF3368 domain-containing protein [Planctomycetota bacterium]
MLVVADTSPIHYLILIGQEDLFPKLFGQVVIPDQVASELSHPHAPQAVSDFMAQKPSWLCIQSPRTVEPIPHIDEGEEAAISLAREIDAELLLIDDFDGRAAARQFGLQIIGTLGVLELASNRHLVDLHAAIHALQKTSMRMSEELIQSMFDRHKKNQSRKKEPPSPE